MEWTANHWKNSVRQFRQFLSPLIEDLGRAERRVAATRYVTGLLLPGERKSVEPMAARLQVDPQPLTHLLADSPWAAAGLWTALRQEVVPHLPALEAWIVDETGWLKQGRQSVGVQHQYCGAVGKQANCQVCVEVVVSTGEIAAPVAGQLYLPESWTKDRPRCTQAGVPPAIHFATKPQIAAALLKQVVASGVQKAPVLGDCAYGDNAAFRTAVRQLGLEFFLTVDPTKHKGWLKAVRLVRGRKLRRVAQGQPAAQTLLALARGLSASAWQACTWKAADGRTRRTRLAWVEVYLQEGLDGPANDLERVWLVVDWPAGNTAPYHCYLAQWERPPPKGRCLRLSRGRSAIEQYFQRGKTDLGLDHHEGRSWLGFEHHLVLAALAYWFVLLMFERIKKNFWPDVGTDTPRDAAVVGEIARVLRLLRREIPQRIA
jgi:SRSO17 transposase